MHRSQLKQEMLGFIRRMSPQPIQQWREAVYFRRYGEFELRLVKPLCDADRDSIDVGANLGAYIHFMRRSAKLVYAFEPVPWLARMLARKFTARVIVRDIALSNENGTAVLRVPVVDGQPECGLSSLASGANFGTSEQMELRVTTSRLDDVYDGRLGFLKIDVEGHEQAVLEGASRTLDRSHPNLLVEIEERFAPGRVRETRSFLEGLGYRGYFVSRGLLHEIESFDPASMQRLDDISGFGAGQERTRYSAYVNNFIFIHRSAVNETLPRIQALTAN